MKIPNFALERYFAQHEFRAPYLLSCSDCEALSVEELLDMADAESLGLWQNLRLHYTESQGHPLLREAIAALYDNIDATNILIAAPEEAIFLFMHGLLEADDHVVVMTPAYQSLHEVARSIGCTVENWSPVPDSQWQFDVEQLEAKIRPETRLLVVNFPHNPTGYLPSTRDFQAIIELARQHDIYVLVDEMYRYLELRTDAPLPAACDLYDKAVSLSGLSKSFGLPGLRIGWLASRSPGILQQVLALKDYTTICNSAPSEILAIIGLRNRATIIERQLDRLRRNLDVLDQFFDDRGALFRWTRPDASSVAFPQILIDEDTSTFCDELVRDAGIMLVPSKLFQYGESHVRIGFGRNSLPEVIDRFSEYLDRHYG